jgi:tRNA (guanine26-N2/guanine27-N2)-dimethyltransferase
MSLQLLKTKILSPFWRLSQLQASPILIISPFSGLRSIRYAKEIPRITNIVANDIDIEAVEAIKRNVEYNKVDSSLITPNHADARFIILSLSFDYFSTLMNQNRSPEKRFTVVDIDPYGGASPFLDSAVQAVDEGGLFFPLIYSESKSGLLCVTCTDMAVLCGNNSEVCWAKYGSLSLHGRYLHEMGIRIVLASLDSHAAR